MKRNKKGFTIVELVIVIAVIAILSAILIPTFVNLTDKANDARAKSEVADVYTAYIIKAEASAKTQEQVVITRDGKDYTYTQAEGWKVPTAAVSKGAQLFDNGNDNGTAEAGEIVVYALGA